MSKPQFDPDILEQELEQRSRRPFRAILARILRCAPSEEAIREQAEKHPDRYAQVAAIFGRLGGYNDKLEIEGQLNLQIQALSDAELEARVAHEIESLDRTSSDLTDK